ncbi:MAG TPA: translocase [Vicinamibacteria bacterium]|nr:translocase [Vicinamibacteria bacterium]
MADETAATIDARPGLLDRVLRVFSDVRAGEGGTVLLMFANLFLLLVSYYVIRVVRDAMILATGGAVAQSYAAAGMALVLMAFIPLYSWFATRTNRVRLILGVMAFFVVTLEFFALSFSRNAYYVAVAFFIWVGIFNNATVAQFWSFANDLYRRDAGERLFPIMAIGATLGAPIGSKIAEVLFEEGLPPQVLLQIAAGMLLVHLALYIVVQRREVHRRVDQVAVAQAPIPPGNGFALVFANPYLRLVAIIIIILNIVNTNGNFIFSSAVVRAADAAVAGNPSLDKVAFIGAYTGGFLFYQNVIAFLVQAFLVSRIVKYLGMPGVLLVLPLAALGGNALIAAGAGLSIIRWAKTAENAADYSVMNTGRQMLWLPTRREEKYKAKQAVDTFFVRFGDVLSAALVFAGTHWLSLQGESFAVINLVLVVVWIGLLALLLRRHRELSARAQAEEAAAEAASA